MKKVSCLLTVIAAFLAFNMNVKAESPIKSVDFCGAVTITDVTEQVRLSMTSNTCKVSVELNDASYTVVSGAGDVEFKDGENVHNIVVKDAVGTEQTYPITVNFNSGYNSSNPSTGDATVMLCAAGVVCIALIAVSINRIKKYSKNIA